MIVTENNLVTKFIKIPNLSGKNIIKYIIIHLKLKF